MTSEPHNAERLRRERLTKPAEFLVAYLIEGKPAFREREAPSAAETITLIHNAGGVAVWAHPFWDIDADAEVIATLERFVGARPRRGVEAFYLTHTQALKPGSPGSSRNGARPCPRPVHLTFTGPVIVISTAFGPSTPTATRHTLGAWPISDAINAIPNATIAATETTSLDLKSPP